MVIPSLLLLWSVRDRFRLINLPDCIFADVANGWEVSCMRLTAASLGSTDTMMKCVGMDYIP